MPRWKYDQATGKELTRARVAVDLDRVQFAVVSAFQRENQGLSFHEAVVEIAQRGIAALAERYGYRVQQPESEVPVDSLSGRGPEDHAGGGCACARACACTPGD